MSAPTYRLLIGGPLDGKVEKWERDGRHTHAVQKFVVDMHAPEVVENYKEDMAAGRIPYKVYSTATYEARQFISNGLEEVHQPPAVYYIAIYRE